MYKENKEIMVARDRIELPTRGFSVPDYLADILKKLIEFPCPSALSTEHSADRNFH